MNYKECAHLLLQKNNILLLTHKNPDGDTVGSAAALCSALRRAGKTAFLYENKQFTKKLLPYASEYIAPENFAAEFTLAVDIASEAQYPIEYEGSVDLCIDHHPSNSFYAAETLFACHIRPQRQAAKLTRVECDAIVKNAKRILRMAIRWGGTTVSDFRNVDGSEGKFVQKLRMYGKSECPDCGARIAKIVLGGRTSWYCPNCQK